ncbi:MAG: pyridine nucleotide-disulfide oxidoreductase [Pirellula sp.]|nr:pyridine nucleotide-disulfide oxidoreductase [Pirellula sp.]
MRTSGFSSRFALVIGALLVLLPPARGAELKSAAVEAVDGQRFDVVVIGGTPAGIACAVRAARDGCSVLLVQHTQHLGGMMTNGLMQWDALYGGPRAPLFSELLQNIEEHYRTTYGEDSPDFKTVHYSQTHYPIGWVEPHIAEREFCRLVTAEPKITTLLGYYPAAVKREGAILQSVTLGEYSGDKQATVAGDTFVDAMYEGDLMALAKAEYRVGREARSEYDEPHAGKIFTNIGKGPAPQLAVDGKLNIRPYSQKQGSIDPTSPFTADGAIQAFNMRLCVSSDPANRVMLASPPEGYDRAEYVDYERKSIATNNGPNHKSHMNSPILPGENHAYPEADWPTRERITKRHLDFALGLIWFLQNDASVPAAKQKDFRRWGLPKDEYLDNGYLPYEMYVRETRRLVGRHVYTEHDNSQAPGFARAPIHGDSVAVTDWYMDSHSCTTESRPGFHYEGKLILTEESRPGQIPYRALLPKDIDNLIVPLCLSATHIAWGAVRLEPVWMQTGEAAGVAAALAKRKQTTPGELSGDELTRALADKRHLVSFFNDFEVNAGDAWIPAIQYLGTKGFFADYDARPNAPLSREIAELWAEGLMSVSTGKHDGNALARRIAAVAAESNAAPEKPVTAAEFRRLFGRTPAGIREGTAPISRGAAAMMIYAALSAR